MNRAADADRLARFGASASAFGIPFERFETLDGPDPATPFFVHQRPIGGSFWGEDRIKPGALGRFLSHRAAWLRMRADGMSWTRGEPKNLFAGMTFEGANGS